MDTHFTDTIATCRAHGPASHEVGVENASRWDYALPVTPGALFPTFCLDDDCDHNSFVDFTSPVLALGLAQERTQFAAVALAQYLCMGTTEGFYLGGPDWVRTAFDAAPGIIDVVADTTAGITNLLQYAQNITARDAATPILAVVDTPAQWGPVADLIHQSSSLNIQVLTTTDTITTPPAGITETHPTRLAFGDLTADQAHHTFPAWAHAHPITRTSTHQGAGLYGTTADTNPAPIMVRSLT